jgi:hypothetical protein
MLRTALLCLVVSGCLDSRSGRRAAESDTTAPDTTAPDTSTADIGPVETSPVCEHAALSVVDVGIEASDDGRYDYFNPVLLDGVTLHAAITERDDRGDGRRNVQLIDLVNDTRETLVDPDYDHYMLDARDGVLLFGATDAGVTELRYHDSRDGTTRVLERYEIDPPLRLTANEYHWGRVARVVERDVALWAESGYEQGKTRTRVKLWSDGATRVLYDDFSPSLVLELHRGNVAWSVVGAQPGLWLARPGQTPTKIAEGTVYELAFNDQSLFWIVDGIVWRHDLADGSQRQISDEKCTALVAQGTHAAAVCGGDEETGWLAMAPGQPTVFDGDRATAITVGSDRVIAGLTLFGNRMAWVEYPPLVDCRGQFDMGMLRVSSLRDLESFPYAINRVASGCWCCDAYWPALQIRLSERAIAWNYPMGVAEVEYPSPDALGWALFDACE